MSGMEQAILVINAGSSSVKFAVFPLAGTGVLAHGQIEGIGTGARAVLDGEPPDISTLAPDADHSGAIAWLLAELAGKGFDFAAAGHRVVHGGERLAVHCRIDAGVEAEIERLVPLARSHNPHNLAAIRAVRANWPGLPQFACFDTAFHATQPALATTLALPESVRARGVRRYGFHGLSYQSVSERLAALFGAVPERAIVAHLGNGASLCAMRNGRSIATTMGFTPLDGLIMGTRPGLADPGAILFMIEEMGMDAGEVSRLLSRESGLKGLSGISGDMRTLETSTDPAAAFAIDLYCYRIVREAGSLAAALGGLDAVVFTGGVGENSARIRERVMAGLGWLGLEGDTLANQAASSGVRAGAMPVVSSHGSAVRAGVMKADEESVIAGTVRRLLAAGG